MPERRVCRALGQASLDAASSSAQAGRRSPIDRGIASLGRVVFTSRPGVFPTAPRVDSLLRHDLLLSHALLRVALSRYADVPPASWIIAIDRYGRPELAGPGSAHGLRFNLSHAKGLATVAVVASREVGIDVENVTREFSLESYDSVSSPNEIRDSRSLTEDQ
jgi:hypothetical protein